MTDVIVGYPSNLTTVTAGTGGNVRVTYAPWELDWEWFDTIVVGNWLANTTSAVSAAITAKGGAENLGYWFEIGVAFPDANWASGNRITPQRQAGISQFATPVAAIAAMAVMDVLLFWYPSNTSNKRVFGGPKVNFANKPGSAWGMLSRCQCAITSNVPQVVEYSGDNSAQINQVFLRNLTLSWGVYTVIYNATVGKEGMGIRCTRLRGLPGYLVLECLLPGGGAQVDNCYFRSGNAGPLVWNPALLYNNTVIRSLTGYYLNNQAHTITNCVAAECGLDYRGTAGATITFCADTDGSLPVAAGNLRNQNIRSDFRFFYDMASPGRKKFACFTRVHRDSVLSASGLAVPAIPRDADGRIRPNPPSRGPWESDPTCYAPAGELLRGTVKRGVNS